MTVAQRELRERWPDLVGSAIAYGAVDIDAVHLVVWVCLSGPAQELPTWFFPTGDPAVDAPLALGLLTEIIEMTVAVRRLFAAAHRPSADRIAVGFDSDERIRQSGGWQYFNS